MYYIEDIKNKEIILDLMQEVLNVYGEWWIECGLLPEINTLDFLEWLKINKPLSYQNALLNEGDNLEYIKTYNLLSSATGSSTCFTINYGKLKNKIYETKIDLSSEYLTFCNSFDDYQNIDLRQMELIAEYALTNDYSMNYLLNTFNKVLDLNLI
jgi:hypothetical protein